MKKLLPNYKNNETAQNEIEIGKTIKQLRIIFLILHLL